MQIKTHAGYTYVLLLLIHCNNLLHRKPSKKISIQQKVSETACTFIESSFDPQLVKINKMREEIIINIEFSR